MKKKTYVVCMALLVATLLALPGVARSAMWVGGQLGGNFAASTDVQANVLGVDARLRGANVSPSVIGGVTIGYDFVNTGFLGYAWPDWMKYFSVATDFTYNRFDIRPQNVDVDVQFRGFAAQGQLNANIFQQAFGTIETYMATWTFMLMAHYGFLPDSEVPAGRLHPYIGVGPGILFSGVDVKFIGHSNSVNIALVTEAGLRFFPLKNVSLDAAFRYRYASPTYDYDFAGIDFNVGFRDAHQFSFLFRASYHF